MPDATKPAAKPHPAVGTPEHTAMVEQVKAGPPGFDGTHCDVCRGQSRLTECPKCHGTEPKS